MPRARAVLSLRPNTPCVHSSRTRAFTWSKAIESKGWRCAALPWLLPWRQSWDPGSQQKVGTAIRFRPDSIDKILLILLSRHKWQPHSTGHVTRRLSRLPSKLHINNSAPPCSKHRYIRSPRVRASLTSRAAESSSSLALKSAATRAGQLGRRHYSIPPTRNG